jgi:hypothetical protein
MIGEWRIGNEVVVAEFEVLTRNLPGRKEYKDPSRTASVRPEIWTQHLPEYLE